MATALMRMTRPPGRIVGGRVFLGDVDLMKLDDNALRKIRLRDIAFVPQGAMNSLNPVMRIEDQMIDAIVAHETRAARRRQLDARVVAAAGQGRAAADGRAALSARAVGRDEAADRHGDLDRAEP